MICGHGSRDPEACREFDGLVASVQARLEGHKIEGGFLEFARPIISEGLDALRAQHVREILAVPAMLFAAGHAKNDIPSVLNTYQAQHETVPIHYGRALGIEPALLKAAERRITDAIERAGAHISRHDTLLVVVGRGASDPDANANMAKVMRMLWEGMGFGWGEVAYSGVTFPLVEPALLRAVRLGFKRIVVFPWFLFTGVLVKRVYGLTDKVAASHQDIEFVRAGYFNDHPLVVDTFVRRIEEIRTGDNLMNCKLCKYREQIPGFEDQVGLAQMSHHHHVEGIGVGDGHTHTHHGEGGGHHHPYPHEDHPLGPVSLKPVHD